MGYIHTTIRKALAQAEAWDLVRKNVARFAKPPRENQGEPDTMTVEEAQGSAESPLPPGRYYGTKAWRAPGPQMVGSRP